MRTPNPRLNERLRAVGTRQRTWGHQGQPTLATPEPLTEPPDTHTHDLGGAGGGDGWGEPRRGHRRAGATPPGGSRQAGPSPYRPYTQPGQSAAGKPAAAMQAHPAAAGRWRHRFVAAWRDIPTAAPIAAQLCP